ncbi:hypothetical protein ENUP19_0158G0042 [Entamoeba nuttalli]|uniref:Uncharacterized protein n=2 Tax=Entamoeba nuttalli TaxID=412467 RepID=A0ABQ0DLR7_9EUKA
MARLVLIYDTYEPTVNVLMKKEMFNVSSKKFVLFEPFDLANDNELDISQELRVNEDRSTQSAKLFEIKTDEKPIPFFKNTKPPFEGIATACVKKLSQIYKLHFDYIFIRRAEKIEGLFPFIDRMLDSGKTVVVCGVISYKLKENKALFSLIPYASKVCIKRTNCTFCNVKSTYIFKENETSIIPLCRECLKHRRPLNNMSILDFVSKKSEVNSCEEKKVKKSKSNIKE